MILKGNRKVKLHRGPKGGYYYIIKGRKQYIGERQVRGNKRRK